MGTKQVCRLTGATPRMIQWWAENGVVPIQIFGHDRRYTSETLFQISLLVEMRKRGCSLLLARKVLRLASKFQASEFIIFTKRITQLCGVADVLKIAVKIQEPVWIIDLRTHRALGQRAA
jgi:DNA-binding transcriptional MerR regulator